MQRLTCDNYICETPENIYFISPCCFYVEKKLTSNCKFISPIVCCRDKDNNVEIASIISICKFNSHTFEFKSCISPIVCCETKDVEISPDTKFCCYPIFCSYEKKCACDPFCVVKWNDILDDNFELY